MQPRSCCPPMMMIAAEPTTALRHALLTDRERTLTALYAATFPAVKRLVRRQGGTADEARDVFHDAVVVFYEKAVAGTLTLTSPPGAYLAGIARHLWQRELERRRRGPVLTAAFADDLAADLADAPPAETPPASVLDYVARLGARCRDLLVAFYYFRQPLEQITRDHEYGSVRSATVQKYKCLERLRNAVRHLAAELLAA